MMKERSGRPTSRLEAIEVDRLARQCSRGELAVTREMPAVAMIDLLDESATEDSVVDLHHLEAVFASGSSRIVLPDLPLEATRRMSAEEIIHAEPGVHVTARMDAVQSEALVALTAPIAPTPIVSQRRHAWIWMLGATCALIGGVVAIALVGA